MFVRSMMFFAVLLLFHLLFFAYPVIRICDWLGLNSVTSLVIFLPLFFSQVISRLIIRKSAKNFIWIRYAADFFLGLSPFLLFSVVLFEFAIFFQQFDEGLAAQFSLALSLLIGFWGLFSAVVPRVKTIQLRTEKIEDDFDFVQISDVHIGSRSRVFLERLVEKINSLNPKFLCITGDFIDATGVNRSELVSLQKLDCPIFFSIGNHERYEDLDKILERLASLGVTILRSEVAHPSKEIQLIGIDDQEDVKQVDTELKKINFSQNVFTILMYHRPKGFEDAEKAGIDLMLSGHTHKGQVFPFNLVVKKVFRYVSGLHRLGSSLLYVSQGTGTWGPVMRVGSFSEITLFEVKNEPKAA